MAATAVIASSASTPRQQAARLMGTAELKEVYTSADGRLTAFNRAGGGFVLATADAVAGYSETGAFDPADIPPALAALLQMQNGAEKAPQHVYNCTAVKPLLGDIAFDQTEPYNLLCPVYTGYTRSATGCVATAMSQIMRYHRFPESGLGTHNYIPETLPEAGTLTVDFTQSRYDWANILPSYAHTEYTQAQADAVSRLLYDAGVSVSMAYGPQSGAMNEAWPEAVTSHFGYDKGVTLRRRQYYTSDEWLGIIHAELAAGRPVYAGGYATAGGHAFVFDGMDERGFIHVNWGWSGMSNGYFSINLLTPPTQGTGGADGGFNARQVIVTGIQPPTEGTEPAVELVADESLRAPRSLDKNGTAELKLNGNIRNVGWQPSTVDFVLTLLDANGNTVASWDGTPGVNLNLTDKYRGVSFPEVSFADVPEGRYTLTAQARNHGGSLLFPIHDSQLAFPHRLAVTVEDDGVKFAQPEMFSLTCPAPATEGNLYTGLPAVVRATVTNNGESHYRGELRPALLDPSTRKSVETAAGIPVDIAPGTTEEIEIPVTFTADAGEYLLSFYDSDTALVGQPAEVTLQSAVFGALTAVGAPDFGDNLNVDPHNMQCTATVKGGDGTYSGYVTVYLYRAETIVTESVMDQVFLQAAPGEQKTLTLRGDFENAVPGAEYDACLVDASSTSYVQPREAGRTRIRISPSASVTGTYGEHTPARYYDLRGNRLPSAPQKGVYIEVRGTSARKVIK